MVIINGTSYGSKTAAAKALNVSRASLYYKKRMEEKDLALKAEIKAVWRQHPSYGHRRLAIELSVNKKRVLRVMRRFGLKPYRRRTKRPRKQYPFPAVTYPNLVKRLCPIRSGVVWVADFTYISYRSRFIYLATVMDLFTREVMGWHVSIRHTKYLVEKALDQALSQSSLPAILHSDQGSEYTSLAYLQKVETLGIRLSFSERGSPWQNGHQEAFYSQFKLDLGDPERFDHLGELVEAIHHGIHYYNNDRIHTALKMPPALFTFWHDSGLHKLSKKRGT